MVTATQSAYLIATFVSVFRNLYRTLANNWLPNTIATGLAYSFYVSNYCQHTASVLSIIVEGDPVTTLEHMFNLFLVSIDWLIPSRALPTCLLLTQAFQNLPSSNLSETSQPRYSTTVRTWYRACNPNCLYHSFGVRPVNACKKKRLPRLALSTLLCFCLSCIYVFAFSSINSMLAFAQW